MVEKANYTTIQYEKSKDDPHIVHIRLNRPDKNNAISIGAGKMTAELQDAVRRVNEDEKVKVVIYSGNGRNFCAGFDLSDVYRVYHGAPGVRPLQSKRLQVDFDHVGGLPRARGLCYKVSIAQGHGGCFGGGRYLGNK